MKDMVKLKRADLEQILRDALRLGAQGLMEELDGKAIPMNEAGREYGFSIERDEDKVYADFVDVDEDIHASTYGDAEHVAAWIAERLGVGAQDAKRRLDSVGAALAELTLARQLGEEQDFIRRWIQTCGCAKLPEKTDITLSIGDKNFSFRMSKAAADELARGIRPT